MAAAWCAGGRCSPGVDVLVENERLQQLRRVAVVAGVAVAKVEPMGARGVGETDAAARARRAL